MKMKVGQAVWWETPVEQHLRAGRIVEIDNLEREPIFKIETFDSIEFLSGVELNLMSDEDIEFVLSAARRAVEDAIRCLTRPRGQRDRRQIMGMYTAFEFDAVLAKDAPHQVKSLLKTSIEGNNPIVPLPDHAFFKCERWFCLFTSGTFRILEGDRIILRSWIKNYDDEIGKFVDWITPYLSALKGEMLGYKMYEETEWPTLLHHPNTWTPTGSLGPGEEW